jgi:hypothetical protein
MRTGISIAARLFPTAVSAIPLCVIHKAEKDHSGLNAD